MPGYLIKNMVGSTETRRHRWNSPFTHRCKQIIGHHRLLPNQAREMTEEHFKQNEHVILQKVKNGELMVTTPDGTTITSVPGGTLVYRRRDGQTKVVTPDAWEPANPGMPARLDAPVAEKEEEVLEKVLEAEPVVDLLPEPDVTPVERPLPKVEEISYKDTVEPSASMTPSPDKREKNKKGKNDGESKKSHGSH